MSVINWPLAGKHEQFYEDIFDGQVAPLALVVPRWAGHRLTNGGC